MIIIVSFLFVFLIALLITKNYSVELQPSSDEIIVPPGYYKFTLANSPNVATFEHLQLHNSGIELVRRLTDTQFIGYSNGGALLGMISGYESFSPEGKFDGDLNSISTNNYLLLDSLQNPGNRVCFITIRFFENLDFSSIISGLGLNLLGDRDNERFLSLDPCDDNSLQSKINELVLLSEVESVRINPNAVASLYNIGTRTGAYSIQSGINPYTTPYTGQGMKIGFWDFGSARNHPDFENRLRVRQCSSISCSLFNQFNNNHPTMMAGVLLGAGILWNQWYSGLSFPPVLIGVAPDADGYSYDLLDAAGEMLWAHDIYGIDVSSNSWHWAPAFAGGLGSSGPRIEYEARNFDRVAYELADTPLVFAAGNTVCDPTPGSLCQLMQQQLGIMCDPEGYYNPVPGVAEWDCLFPPSSTKNVLTVGSIAQDGSISDFSSRGPTWDGRIKPDVVSLGEDIITTDFTSSASGPIIYPTYTNNAPLFGTSFSAPTVAAHSVLLKELLDDRTVQTGLSYEGYESALIKAAFVHTATDIELPGPDFLSGWGEINPREAMNVLAGNTLVLDSFNEQNKHEVKKYPISIPPWSQITEPLKITFVWNDYWDFAPTFQVPRNDLRELVNNLELYLCDASGSAIERPFVLDWQHPGVPATRGFNDRDNVEQVLATPQVIRNYITTQTQSLFACVKFQNYYNTPAVNQKFVLIIGDGSTGPGSYEYTCGNGQFEPQYGEECDKIYLFWNYGSQTCANYGGGQASGTSLLRCNAQCKIDGILCESPMCGNGNKGLGEMCDDSDPSSVNDCALSCFGPETGAAKACKCSCTNDNECSGPGRGVMQCDSNGVCQGVGDGELDFDEECDASSTTPVSVSCANIYRYTPKGATGWLCDENGKCRDPNNMGDDEFWCPRGNKVIPNPPACTQNSDCPPGDVCNNDCVCEANPKYLCVSNGVVLNKGPKTPECSEAGAGIARKDCRPKDETCVNCKCVKKPRVADATYSLASICPNNLVETGIGGSGEECDPPGSNCYMSPTSTSPGYNSICTSNCRCPREGRNLV